MTSLTEIVLALQAIGDYLTPVFGFDAFVSLVLAILVAAVILQNRRKNQRTALEMEGLIRRYSIFRGHRQSLMKIHQQDDDIKHEILKTISNSWNHFKSMLDQYAISLRKTDRRAKNFLLILGVLMALNSLRVIALGVQTDRVQWSGLVLIVRELPMYFFLATGFLLISIQSQRLAKSPLASINAELESIFSDTEQTQEALNNEFDPIEQSFAEEDSWKEES